MNQNMEKYYQILGLQPGASAEEIKQAYRKLAKKWHPDTLGSSISASEKEKAEQKFNEITNAYRTLIHYAKVQEIIKNKQQEGGSPSTTQPSTQTIIKHKNTTYTTQKTPKTLIQIVFGLCCLIAIFIALANFHESQNEVRYLIINKNKAISISTTSSNTKNRKASEKEKKRPLYYNKYHRDFFSIFSTKDEVLSVQGTPDRISGRKWFYGLSSVTFENDRVIEYDNFDGRLRVKMLPKKLPDRIPSYFTIGSEKDEVLLVQGTPSRVRTSVWYYGLDKVFFENGRVVGYDNFTGSLKVKLIPRNPVKKKVKGFFSIGSTKDEVIALQGTPTRIIGNKWYYGLSEIVFKNGRVVHVTNISHNLKFSPTQKKKKL